MKWRYALTQFTLLSLIMVASIVVHEEAHAIQAFLGGGQSITVRVGLDACLGHLACVTDIGVPLSEGLAYGVQILYLVAASLYSLGRVE